MPPRPTPTSFAHNVRVAFVCAPALLLVLDVSGGSIAGIVALGTMLTYIFNVLGWREVCVAAVWLTAAILGFRHAAGALAVLGATLRGLGLAALGASFAALLGVWATLNLEWFVAAQPALAHLLEQLLFAALPVPCALLPAWGAAALVGAQHTPAVLLASIAAAYCALCGRRLACSFPPPGADARAAPPPPCAPAVAAAHAIVLLVLPAACYAALHAPTLFASWRSHAPPLLALPAIAALVVATAASARVGRFDVGGFGAVVAMATAVGAFAVASDVGFVEAGATLLLSAVAIGCTLLRDAPTLRCVALLCHAILLGFVELHLLAEDSAAAGDDGGAYPPWLVAATVGGGLLVVERLHADDGRMAPPPICWWLLLSVHAGRAALLVEPTGAAWRAAILGAAAFTQPLQRAASRRELRLFDAAPPPMAPAVAVLRLALLGWATLTAHSLLLPTLLRAVTPRPSPPVVTGTAVALFAAGASQLVDGAPAAARSAAQSLCVLVGAGGTLCALVQVKRRHYYHLLHINRHTVPSPPPYIRPQPPLDPVLLIESIGWTLLHPTASLSFGGTRRLLLWPPWGLLLLLEILLAAALGLLPLRHLPPPARLLGAAAIGAAAALCASGALLPLERTLFLLHAAAAALGASLLAVVLWPQTLAPSARVPATLLAALAALFPIGLHAQHVCLAHSAAARTLGAPLQFRAAWVGTYAGVAAVAALALKLHTEPPQTLRGRAAAADGRRRAAAAPEWAAPAATALALSSLALALGAAAALYGATARAIVPTAPLLLLLPARAPPFASLDEGNRYAPVGTAIALGLGGAAALEVFSRLGGGGGALRAAALVACTLPSLVGGCVFLWTRRRTSVLLALGAAPPSLIPLLLSHSRPLSDLGAAGLAAGLAHVVWLLAGRARATHKYV